MSFEARACACAGKVIRRQTCGTKWRVSSSPINSSVIRGRSSSKKPGAAFTPLHTQQHARQRERESTRSTHPAISRCREPPGALEKRCSSRRKDHRGSRGAKGWFGAGRNGGGGGKRKIPDVAQELVKKSCLFGRCRLLGAVNQRHSLLHDGRKFSQLLEGSNQGTEETTPH